MTDETIDVLLRGEIEAVVLPTVPDVAAGAAGQVGRRRDAEVVDDVFLAQFLAGDRVGERPGPVRRLVDLPGRFGVAFQAGSGDLRPGSEVALQLFIFLVVGRRTPETTPCLGRTSSLADGPFGRRRSAMRRGWNGSEKSHQCSAEDNDCVAFRPRNHRPDSLAVSAYPSLRSSERLSDVLLAKYDIPNARKTPTKTAPPIGTIPGGIPAIGVTLPHCVSPSTIRCLVNAISGNQPI